MANVTLTMINGRKAKKGEKKPTIVELRMTFNKRSKYLSTGIKVLPNQFKNGQVVKHPDATALNEKINRIMSKALQCVNKMESDGVVDLEALPKMITTTITNKTFWQYVEEQARNRNVGDSTKDRYYVWLGKVKEWEWFKTFSELTGSNIKLFDKFLHDQGYKQSTIATYHKYLKLFVNDAVIDGFIKENPYKTLRLKIDKGEGRIDKYLTDDEVHAIEYLILDEHLAHARDAFIFCCYTGLAYSDYMAFGKDKVLDDEGTFVLVGKRVKDDVEYIVPLLPQAMAILERYNWQLPKMSNQKFNDYLKAVAARASVDKPISFHWARHTAGMLMLNNGVSYEIVAKVLGHANIMTTQKVYAKVQMKAVIREIKKYAKTR